MVSVNSPGLWTDDRGRLTLTCRKQLTHAVQRGEQPIHTVQLGGTADSAA